MSAVYSFCAGELMDGENFTDPAISPDGRYVAFQWTVHDRVTGATERIPYGRPGVEHTGLVGIDITLNGRFVAHTDDYSHETGRWAYVRDRGVALGVGDLVASGRAARLSLQESSSFSQTGDAVLKDADSDALASKLGLAGELIEARVTYRPALNDIFVVMELESMPRTPALAAVTAGTLYGLSLKVDGKPYEIRATSTGLGAFGETTASFGLFDCSASFRDQGLKFELSESITGLESCLGP